MKVAVRKLTASFSERGSTRLSYQVVDVDAGINGYGFPKRVIATCRDESDANYIAATFSKGWPLPEASAYDALVVENAKIKQAAKDADIGHGILIASLRRLLPLPPVFTIAELEREINVFIRRSQKTGAYVLNPSADVVRDQNGILWKRM